MVENMLGRAVSADLRRIRAPEEEHAIYVQMGIAVAGIADPSPLQLVDGMGAVVSVGMGLRFSSTYLWDVPLWAGALLVPYLGDVVKKPLLARLTRHLGRLRSLRNGLAGKLLLNPPLASDLIGALRRLRGGGTPTGADVVALLQQTVFSARTVLVRSYPKAGNALTPDNLAVFCAKGQSSVTHSVGLLNKRARGAIKVHNHQAAEVFGPAFKGAHAFDVLEMPNGGLFLVDATFAQFFAGGSKLKATGKALEYQTRLVVDGFLELTDEVATWYARTVSAGPMPGRTTIEALRSSTATPLHPIEALEAYMPPLPGA